jgi:hypothetical protein
MITKTRRRSISSVGNAKIENSARKFRNQNSPSFAVLQPRRRERLPLEIVAVLRALTGDGNNPIVFAAKEELS